MNYRYDFGEKLDVAKLQAHISFYIRYEMDMSYELFTKSYKIVVSISGMAEHKSHQVSITLHDIKRDDFGTIISVKGINPSLDTRFKEIKIVKDLFDLPNTFLAKAHFNSTKELETASKIIELLKIIHKIDNLKVFL